MRPSNPNLPNKLKIWELIQSYQKEYLYTPTYQEIANYMDFINKQQVSYYIKLLKAEGKISVIPRTKRSIKIL